MLNLSPLFYSTVEPTTLLGNIELSEQKKEVLAEAKTHIRRTLREALPVLLQQQYQIPEKVSPRFFTQGSWAYKTLNAPATTPPQQADLDDGCYLPMSFVAEASPRPRHASQAFFEAVEVILGLLSKTKGWRLDTSKPTCVRIEVSAEGHIDVPLYAIPDSQFITLEKAASQRGYAGLFEAAGAINTETWTRVDTVLLAHRQDGWMKSDPRAVKDWFLQQTALPGGEQLRRVVRYLKAWRDNCWTNGGPSSLLLMAAAAEVFQTQERRDDIALLNVVTRLPERLKNGVCNPADPEESLTERLGAKGVEDLKKLLQVFQQYLEGALSSSDPSQACAWMQNQFGIRFPNAPASVKPEGAAAAVAATAAEHVKSPLVGRQQAG